MPEQISFDLSPALADRVRIDRLVQQLMLVGDGGSLMCVRKEDRVTVICSLTTGVQLAERLRRQVFESDSSRDAALASNAVLKKLNAALDATVNSRSS